MLVDRFYKHGQRNTPLFALLILFHFCIKLNGQTPPLYHISYHTSNTQNIDDVLSKVSELASQKNEEAVIYNDSGLYYAKKYDLKNWQVYFNINSAGIYLRKNENALAIKHALEALRTIQIYNIQTEHIGKAHLYLAEALNRIGAISEAIKHKKEHLKTFNKDEKKIMFVQNYIGQLYSQINKHDSSRIYYNASLNYARKHHIVNREYSSINDIGVSFYLDQQIDSALIYFNKTYRYFKTKNSYTDNVMTVVGLDNLIKCYLKTGNKKQLKKLIPEDIKRSKFLKENIFLKWAYYRMSAFHFITGNYDKTLVYLDSATHVQVDREDEELIIIQPQIFDLYTKAYAQKKDYRLALQYKNKYHQLTDSIANTIDQEGLLKSNAEYQLDKIYKEITIQEVLMQKKQQEYLILDKSNQNLKLIYGIATLGLSALALLFYFLYYRVKTAKKSERLVEKLKQKELNTSLEIKSKLLTQAVLNLSRKKEYSEKIQAKLREINGIDSQALSSMNVFIKNEINLDESSMVMNKYLSELEESFFTKLKLNYPQLSEGETKLCALILTGLTNKEIAITRNITPASVKISKNRLRKKMGLEAGINIGEVLKNL